MLYTDLGTASENSEDRIRKWRLAQPGLNMPNYGFVVFPDDAPLKRDGRLRLRTEKFRQRLKWRLETLAETENRESGRFENPALHGPGLVYDLRQRRSASHARSVPDRAEI